MSTEIESVIDRERRFHNERFFEETRPAQEKYYWAILDCDKDLSALVRKSAVGGRALEYGCSFGGGAFEIADIAKQVDGIDISDVAIEKAQLKAEITGVDNVTFTVGDAHATPYDDNTFDIVFGSGIIHHLDTERSLKEIERILKPGGVAVFKEPLGSNILINLYRALTPSARTPDEHPLLPSDFRISRATFEKVEWKFYGLLTLATVPFRGGRFGRVAYNIAAKADKVLAAIPGVRWQLWYALMIMRKSK